MDTVMLLMYIAINTLFVVLVSPLFMSFIKKVKAWTQGRRGPPLLQTYFQLFKLLRKEMVYSTTASFIMRIAPVVALVSILTASLFVPLLFMPATQSGFTSIFLFLYLMVAGRFFMALAGLDAGSSFGGMGSSREMTISAVIEPVVIIVFAALAFVFRSTNLWEVFGATLASPPLSNPPLLLISVSLFIVLIVETSRIPVDNPETHLELTMVHEGMILEQSGPNLALLELAHSIKQTVLMGVLINVIAPWGIGNSPGLAEIMVGAVAFIGKAFGLAFVVGLVESLLAKSRFFRLPAFFMLAFFFSFMTILFELLT